MLIPIPDFLTPEELRLCRERLAAAPWVDGRVTTGHQAAKAKNNAQVPEDHPVTQELGALIVKAAERNALFVTAALPAKILPPLFNRYEGGQTFGTHVDNAIRRIRGTDDLMRTDLSATVFLSAAEDYDGGELTIDAVYGAQRVKLPAGAAILYPASSLHHVSPVTRGTRLASFFWVQSMVRDDGARALLFDLDTAIRRLTATGAESEALVQLTGTYHNLLRRWAEP
jgi:PKHD-type hydroxylase